MAKHSLSKSTFIRGQQCLKSLYLYKNRYFLKDPVPPEQLAKFARGWSVNEYAHALYPGGVDVSPPSQKAVDRTQVLIAEGQTVIYEAAFMYNEVLIAIDILAKTPDGWKAVEVKSSLKLSATYYKDAFLQYYVIKSSGLQLADFQLVHINSEYLRQGEIDLNQLFSAVSVKEQAEKNMQWVEEQIALEKQAISAPKAPPIDIGLHCNDPYPCDFQRLCWKKVPDDSVFEMGGFTKEKQFDLYRQGFLLPGDIPAGYALTNIQSSIVNAHISGSEFVDKEQIKSVLNQFGHPLTFLALLVCRPALPAYDNTHPYQKLIFGASVIRTNSEGNVTESKTLIADTASNPTQQMLVFIENNIKPDEFVVSWNEEMSDLTEKKLFNKFLIIYDKIFNNFIYYHPKITKSNDYNEVIFGLTGEHFVDKSLYFSDIVAGAAYAKIIENVNISKEKSDETEIRKLEEYCALKAKATARIFDYFTTL